MNLTKKFQIPFETINLKSSLTTKSFRDNLRRLFQRKIFQNRAHVAVYIKFELVTKDYKSLGNKFIINFNNKNDINFYINYLLDKFDRDYLSCYEVTEIAKIHCYYYDTDERVYNTFKRRVENRKTFFDHIDTGIKSYLNIPFNILYSSWGDTKISSKNEYIIHNCYFNTDIEAIKIVEQITYKKIVFVTIFFKQFDKPSIQFVDKLLGDGTIQRSFTIKSTDSLVYTFNPNTFSPNFYLNKNILPKEFDKEGNRINILTELKSNSEKEEDAIKKGKIYFKPRFNCITLDIETYLEEVTIKNKVVRQHKILAICFYDGKFTNRFYIGDYSSETMMLTQCFNKLFVEKYKNYNLYIHNGSNFDLIFLIEYLLNRDGIKLVPLYKDNTFLSVTVQYPIPDSDKKELGNIHIKDSYLLLRNSLAKLGKTLNVSCQKDIFPYEFPNSKNLNYIGNVPEYEYFDQGKVRHNEYYAYKSSFLNKNWNLRNETLEYCSKDCVSLYQILIKFRELIEEEFGVDIQNCPTLASLAFRIFKTNYYNSKENPIPLLTKEIYKDLEPWFLGGHVDSYIPSGPADNGPYADVIKKYNSLTDKSPDNVRKVFKKINHYDVNSLYPSVMNDYKYPTDIICQFIGDIKNSEFNELYENNLGLYKVRVKAPNIKHPLLPVKISTQTVYGYNNEDGWIGTYFSEEIKNAEKYGYTFEILGGYVFECKDLFNEYVESLYLIKESSSKDDPMYLIAKMLLNNLFGRFGIDPWLGRCEFYTKAQFNSYVENNQLQRTDIKEVEFTNHILVIFPSTEQFGLQGYLPIAMAVTAYARVVMSEIKNRDDIILFYSDTDSCFILGELPKDLVDPKKLGKWKLEAEYIYAVFLGAKMYGCLDIYGNSYSKVKGYSKTIPLDILSKFLDCTETESLIHTKWIKHIRESRIDVNSKTNYRLRVTDNKRNNIYEGNKLVATSNIKVVGSLANNNPYRNL